MIKAIPMEDWLRGCVYHDGRHGEVTLPTDKVLKIANYIQRTRRSTTDGLIDLGTLEEVPSVNRPQGKWIKRFGSINCSVCKHCSWSESFEHTVRRFKFCPNCGARMKGADDEID